MLRETSSGWRAKDAARWESGEFIADWGGASTVYMDACLPFDLRLGLLTQAFGYAAVKKFWP